MMCRIQWIDCKGKPTPHNAPAIARVVCHSKGVDGVAIPICAEHLETLKASRAHHQTGCTHVSPDMAKRWEIIPLIDQDLYERYRFFHENAGYATPPGKVACALALSKAEHDGERRGLIFRTEDENEEWDGDCPAPRFVLWCAVYAPDEDTDGYRCTGRVLASVGMVGVDQQDDPYLRVIRAELFSEALERLDAEDEEKAATLAQRATYAGVSP